MDAEYFTPMIQDLIGRLGRKGIHLGGVAPSRHEKFIGGTTGNFNYIEIGHLRGDGTTSSTRIARHDAPTRATWYVHAGDVIASTVRPIRRLTALIEDHQDGYICSSGFVVLEPKGVRPKVLLTYLRLPLVCELMNLHTSASMYPAISEKDLLALPFAPPDRSTEMAICDFVTNARMAQVRADQYLQAAKHAVEVAVTSRGSSALSILDGVGD